MQSIEDIIKWHGENRNALGVSEKQIRVLEEIIGRKLPTSLVRLKMVADEAGIGTIATHPVPDWADRGLNFELLATTYSIWPLVNSAIEDHWHPETWPDDLIPIGQVGNGDLILLVYGGHHDEPKVGIWRHEIHDSEKGIAVEVFADSFDEALIRASTDIAVQDKGAVTTENIVKSQVLYFRCPDRWPMIPEEHWYRRYSDFINSPRSIGDINLWLRWQNMRGRLPERGQRILRANEEAISKIFAIYSRVSLQRFTRAARVTLWLSALPMGIILLVPFVSGVLLILARYLTIGSALAYVTLLLALVFVYVRMRRSAESPSESRGGVSMSQYLVRESVESWASRYSMMSDAITVLLIIPVWFRLWWFPFEIAAILFIYIQVIDYAVKKLKSMMKYDES
jgi:hypothetical protein